MGTFAESFRHIKDRKSFYETLDKAIVASEARPEDPGFARVLEQLQAIKKWTRNDKQPSQKKRDSIDICRVISMGYEPMRAEIPEVEEWAKMSGEVVTYMTHWLDDDEFAEVDRYDLPWY
jgi:hypothetical protein